MTFKVAVKKTSRYDVTGKEACSEMQMLTDLNMRHEVPPYTSTQLQRIVWQKIETIKTQSVLLSYSCVSVLQADNHSKSVRQMILKNYYIKKLSLGVNSW